MRYKPETLGRLADRFRHAKSKREKTAIAKVYAMAVKDLIIEGGWTDVPTPADELPAEYMPPEYADYWE